MHRNSISAALAAVMLGTTMLLSGAGSAAALGCDTCSQSSGAGAGKIGTSPAVSPGQTVPLPVQPVEEDQFFRGLVNGKTGVGGPVPVRMACFGPLLPGETGHAFAGQTLEAVRLLHPLPGFPDVGFSGSLADSIRVDFDTSLPDLSPEESIVLSAYNVPTDIPTSLTLPCDGSGAVSFVPSPAGTFARAASVPVQFVGQP